MEGLLIEILCILFALLWLVCAISTVYCLIRDKINGIRRKRQAAIDQKIRGEIFEHMMNVTTMKKGRR